nr:unnamed protein product [Digitaria exilis]
MAAPPRPTARTESTCTTVTARGTHAFRIVGYSLQRGIGRSNFIRSADFAVGGFDWALRFYPDGNDSSDVNDDHVSVYLELRTKNTEVRASYDLRVVEQATGLSTSVFRSSRVIVFKSRASDIPSWGTRHFMKRSALETPLYLRDDCIVIECDVTVIKETQVAETAAAIEIEVPPPDLLENLGKLLESEELADVRFKVKQEVVHAHRVMLAMRSPVFKAELYGPMRGRKRQHINVEDMEPAAFKALLHFIYRDSLPDMDDLDRDENQEMIKHLLVAADRYGIERMKLECESILCKRLDVESVADTLALADQYHCSKLKDACIGFINSSDRKDDASD